MAIDKSSTFSNYNERYEWVKYAIPDFEADHADHSNADHSSYPDWFIMMSDWVLMFLGPVSVGGIIAPLGVFSFLWFLYYIAVSNGLCNGSKETVGKQRRKGKGKKSRHGRRVHKLVEQEENEFLAQEAFSTGVKALQSKTGLSSSLFASGTMLLRQCVQKAECENGDDILKSALKCKDGEGGVEKDKKEYFNLLLTAVEVGTPEAFYHLGLEHSKGDLVRRDAEKRRACMEVVERSGKK